MFVVTPEGVLVADGQGDAAATKGLVDAVAKVTPKPIRYVVIGSDHGDHTGGNAAFPAGAIYVIQPASKAILDRAAAGRSGRGASSWQLPGDAQLVFAKNPIALGGEPIEVLFLGRAHTGGDLSVYLPRQKILFMSEIFLNRVFPAMRSAYPSEWLNALKKAEQMDVNIYIPATASPNRATSEAELRASRRSRQ
jgi:glyoxylase-like metal-dependent hydrolase (beta-lactamase superfamily II)